LSGYAEGAAQIQQANDINDMSRPNSTMTSMILQVVLGALPKSTQLPEALPKFHRQTQLMTNLVPI